jgi:hypothetical protein
VRLLEFRTLEVRMAKSADLATGRRAFELANYAMEWPQPPAAPRWMAWAPWAAILWALAYGALRVWWAVAGAPSFGSLRTDLIVFTGWSAVGLCAAAAGVAIALMTAPWRWPLLVAAWAVSATLLVASALLLLDVVGGLLPGLGVPFHPVAFVSQVACLVEGILVGAAAVAYRRRWRSDCLFCGRTGVRERPAQTPWWAWCAAYLAVAGCLVRLGAQMAVGFESSLLQLNASLLVFEAGFVLAGTVLPLALVYSWGRVVPWSVPLVARPIPRWLLLGPAFAIAGALTAYFGVTLVTLAAATLNGTWVQMTGSLPLAFFWVAVPAYLLWGLGLGGAALGYYQVTRPACRVCGR